MPPSYKTWNIGSISNVMVEVEHLRSQETSASKLSLTRVTSNSAWGFADMTPTLEGIIFPLDTESEFIPWHVACHPILRTLNTVASTWLGGTDQKEAYMLVDERFRNTDRLPKFEWRTIEEYNFVHTLKLLTMAQKGRGRALFSWKEAHQAAIQKSEWPAPDLTLPMTDVGMDHPHDAYRNGYFSFMSILNSLIRFQYPQTDESRPSEMVVERGVGAQIAIGLAGEDVESTSNMPIMQGQALYKDLTISNSFPHPDIACYLARTEGIQLPLLICVAEAKSRSASLRQARSQMMSALHPTMQILLAYHIASNKNSAVYGNSLTVITNEMPDWLFVYGIYYDIEEVIVYAHFPDIRKRKAKGKTGDGQFLHAPGSESKVDRWTLMQVPVAKYNIGKPIAEDDESGIANWPTYVQERVRLAIALMVIRRHESKLAHELSPFLKKFQPETSSTTAGSRPKASVPEVRPTASEADVSHGQAFSSRSQVLYTQDHVCNY